MPLATAIQTPTPASDKNRVATADQHADRTAQGKDLGQRKLLPSEASEPTAHRNVFVIIPEERHSEQATW